ncbi:DinB family protein [Sporosarcina cascadiensis]|uniref:DinB family protein n=1 Tax=Sporosarcina cascadiensis TaxID=2660747 RepID=UPI00129B3EE2|nr:DinB family protein [Sporosarcina cascadiensis]
MDAATIYLEIVQKRFNSVKKLGDSTISQLSEEDIHWKLNDASNSMAVIVKHVSGNMVSRWTDFLTTDGEKSYRNRDREFEDDISSKQELRNTWEKGWLVFLDALSDLKAEDLLNEITIRGEKHTVLEAIERQMSHYSYHVGQMVYIGKQLKGDEWGNLSIPRGESQKYLHENLEKYQS